jgi:hypothetical protein
MDPNRFRRPPLSPPSQHQPEAPSGDAFVIYPPGFFLPVSPEIAAWQQAVYQWAFEQAQQLLKPSIVERDWLGVWN